MKKFCAECGNQLELSQRLCSKCGVANPFFVSTFSFLSDQSDELEKLRIEKERIEKELSEKEEQQNEFLKQEQLRKEAEETEKLKAEKLEKENARREEVERERLELQLKEEILKVKEETIQQQKETIGLVREVREELLQIEEDNKWLKEEIAALSKSKKSNQSEKTEVEKIVPANTNEVKERGRLVSVLVIILGITAVVVFFYFTQANNNQHTDLPTDKKQEVLLQPVEIPSATTDSVVVTDTSVTSADSVPVQQQPISPSVNKETELPKSEADAKPVKQENEFTLTGAKITSDLIGKAISGCDIVIESSSDIEYISNIALVEKTATFRKYKFTAIIVRGNDNYTATPYIYYTDNGSFIKVDGTNCE